MEIEDRRTESDACVHPRRAFIASSVAFGASIVPLSIATAGTTASPIGWVHGSSATLAGAQSLESDVVHGNARVVRGRSWSTIPLHFAIPTPWLDSGRPMRIGAIWLRLQTGSGAHVGSVALHDCETTIARIDDLSLQRPEWGDIRIPFDSPRRIARSIGVTIGCEFRDIERQVGISAVGCEFA